MNKPTMQKDVPLGLDTLPEIKANIGYYQTFMTNPLPWFKEFRVYHGFSIHVARLLAAVLDAEVY